MVIPNLQITFLITVKVAISHELSRFLISEYQGEKELANGGSVVSVHAFM